MDTMLSGEVTWNIQENIIAMPMLAEDRKFTFE